MSWTDDRVELLTKLWTEGKTAAEIAKELGGVTRNAVIGKAHRLKLSNRVSPIQQNKKTVQKKKKSVPQIKSAPKPSKEKAVKKNLDLIDLGPRQCRWPSGDPQDKDFGFCGEMTVAGLPYCLEHSQIAYQAATRNRILKSEEEKELEQVKKSLAEAPNKKVASAA